MPDLYDKAIEVLRSSDAGEAVASKAEALLQAIRDEDAAAIKAQLSSGNEEADADVLEAAQLAMLRAKRELEDDIVAHGSAEEIEAMNADYKAQQETFEKMLSGVGDNTQDNS